METSPTIAQKNFVYQSAAYSSSFSVEFPKLQSLELILIGAELHQDMMEHDRLVLHFKGKPFVESTSIASPDPVKFTYSADNVTKVFNGYVHTVEAINGINGSNTDVICVSASYLLKDSDQQVYTNVTADQVVSKIAAKHSMSATTQRHPRVRNMIVQAGQTDWQICTRLAKQTGFALRTENTTITFVSKDKIYSDRKASAPYFFYVDNPINGVITRADRSYGTIFSFHPLVSDDSPELGIKVDRIIGVTSSVNATTQIKTPLKAPKVSKGVVVPNASYFL